VARRAEARLRALEDRQAIADLVSRYASSQDDRRFGDYEDCFTEDVVLAFPWGTVAGRSGLAERVRELLGSFSSTQHLIGNLQVELDGDRARGRADFAVTMIRADEGRFWHEVGFYRHEYRRTLAGWRFSRIDCISQMRYRGTFRPEPERPSANREGAGDG
jgi:3-phenylpropionate/cinnamic acid dioxygenase small subunit